MGDVIQYTTNGGERWCDISQWAYGTPLKMGEIIAANPDVVIYDVLPPGIVLDIPIIQNSDVQTSAELLPIWKQ